MPTKFALRVLSLVVVAALAAPAAMADPDPAISATLSVLFAERPDDPFVSVVYVDEPRGNYLAFHVSTYLDVKELRVYLIPFKSADRAVIDGALARDEHEVAFQALLDGMRLDMGAQYVSDAGLDGINDQPVPLGQGALRDNFHRQQFADYATADTAYRRWLERAEDLATR